LDALLGIGSDGAAFDTNGFMLGLDFVFVGGFALQRQVVCGLELVFVGSFALREIVFGLEFFLFGRFALG
jgi:hypothetical protein